MGRLDVQLSIPDRRPEDTGALVRVELRDTSMADALHPTVVAAEAVVPPEGDFEVPLTVPETVIADDRRYELFVHVDHDGSGLFAAGDLIVTSSLPVTRADVADEGEATPITAPLTRI